MEIRNGGGSDRDLSDSWRFISDGEQLGDPNMQSDSQLSLIWNDMGLGIVSGHSMKRLRKIARDVCYADKYLRIYVLNDMKRRPIRQAQIYKSLLRSKKQLAKVVSKIEKKKEKILSSKFKQLRESIDTLLKEHLASRDPDCEDGYKTEESDPLQGSECQKMPSPYTEDYPDEGTLQHESDTLDRKFWAIANSNIYIFGGFLRRSIDYSPDCSISFQLDNNIDRNILRKLKFVDAPSINKASLRNLHSNGICKHALKALSKSRYQSVALKAPYEGKRLGYLPEVIKICSMTTCSIDLEYFVISKTQLRRVFINCKQVLQLNLSCCSLSLPPVSEFPRLLKRTAIQKLNLTLCAKYSGWETHPKYLVYLVEGFSKSDLKSTLKAVEFAYDEAIFEEKLAYKAFEKYRLGHVRILGDNET
ncbi:unnamed protein product [Moneuplotes crassus]|uniref:Uncharacterized protein n=1 Tax=Euplotes crassus TaxID=5936 RepID=A0AAD1U4Q3_EUPCR|nr:unnamed protein product [Moneuplotes crassus]